MTRFLNIVRYFTNSITVNSIILVTTAFIISNNVQNEIISDFNNRTIIKLIQYCIYCNKNYHIKEKCKFKCFHLKRQRKKRKKRKQKNFEKCQSNKNKINEVNDSKIKNDDCENVNAAFIVLVNVIVIKFTKSFIYFIFFKDRKVYAMIAFNAFNVYNVSSLTD